MTQHAPERVTATLTRLSELEKRTRNSAWDWIGILSVGIIVDARAVLAAHEPVGVYGLAFDQAEQGPLLYYACSCCLLGSEHQRRHCRAYHQHTLDGPYCIEAERVLNRYKPAAIEPAEGHDKPRARLNREPLWFLGKENGSILP